MTFRISSLFFGNKNLPVKIIRNLFVLGKISLIETLNHLEIGIQKRKVDLRTVIMRQSVQLRRIYQK